MSTADPTQQAQLLEVQALDTQLLRAAHRRRSLPEHEQVATVAAEQATLADRQVQVATVVSDTQRELRKAEADVEQVRTRADRDQQRLDSGQGSPKDLQGLQHEIESLAKRQGELEDVELEVMERLDQAQAQARELDAQAADLQSRYDELVAARDAALAEIDSEEADLTAQRDTASRSVQPELMALFERIRAQGKGAAAARLENGRCGGCRTEFTPRDLATLNARPSDDVVRCEECGAILVRDAQGSA